MRSSSRLTSSAKQSDDSNHEDIIVEISGTSSSSRKRKSSASITETIFKCSEGDMGSTSKPIIVASKIKDAWQRLSHEARTLCLKTVVRLLVFKAGQKESVSRSTINETLVKIDPSYKIYTLVVIDVARVILREDFGFNLISESDLPPDYDKKKTNLFMTTCLKSPNLNHVIAQADERCAYIGFTFAVFHAIFTSPERKIDFASLNRKIRSIDSRFPETEPLGANERKKKANTFAVAELGDGFHGLISRMKKVYWFV